MSEEKILILAKIAILSHCFLNVYENVMVWKKWTEKENLLIFLVQILTGGLPWMTKGPFAMFFGGQDILPELSDMKSGRHIQILCIVSVIFNLSILCRKKYFQNKLDSH